MEILRPPCLLVAMSQLQDPNFWHSVLLLVEFNEDGALGFIMNRPSEVPVAAIIKDAPCKVPPKIPAWTGGPVGSDNGLVLTNQKVADHWDDDAVTKTIRLASSDNALSSMVAHAEEPDKIDCLYPFRFLVGYSGWGAGQLDDEIRDGAWLQLPLQEGLLFNTPWRKLWDECLKCLEVNPVAITSPAQEYLN